MNDPTFSVTLDGETLIQRTFIEPVQKWLLSPGQAMFDFDLNDQDPIIMRSSRIY